ncbi:Bile pigment transporter 1 [Labeo rohita]|uniref:Bile pigment transporter 1 n=1 Tax=Labeo rohita TaxID=84645 RepID=A0ABQ8L136_LABRO|nr:Bile pigment transporter 1 [Labeo rohita]
MHLPTYLDDQNLLDELEGWGVFPISKIKRRLHPGTEIEDGTRFVKARFPREVVSLPYSTRLETAEGPQYFRVMHSHQVKTCRLCMSPDHLVKDCPDFKCCKCEERRHSAHECDAVKCPECRKYLNKCECWMEEEEGGGDVQVSGQMHEGNNEERSNGEEQEAAGAQQIATEEETNDGEITKGEMEKETDNQQRGQLEDLTWTPMDITPNFKSLLDSVEKDDQKEQSKEMDSETEKRKEEAEKDKVERR